MVGYSVMKLGIADHMVGLPGESSVFHRVVL